MKVKVFLIGFNEEEANVVKEALKGLSVFEVPEYCRDWIVGDVVEKAGTLSGSCYWHLRKFVIMHGVDNETLKDAIKTVRSLDLGRIIFATTTETSLTWKLEDLLDELMAEDEYFQALRWAREQGARKKGPFLDLEKG